MKLSLNTNIGSIKAQNQLLKASEKLQTSFERLSSGLRINRASDDPAGLAMASSLQTDSRLMAQAVRNVNDGISLLAIAESALKELNNILGRQAELAQQAANGVYTSVQRATIQKESDELIKEYNRIIETTEFNNSKLLNLSRHSVQITAGCSADDAISLYLGNYLAREVGDGTFTSGASTAGYTNQYNIASADFNNDGDLDIAVGDLDGGPTNLLHVSLGNGDGSFGASMSFDVGWGPISLTSADLNADGNTDMLVVDTFDSTVSVLAGNGNGTFQARTIYSVGANPTEVKAVDVNGDNILDMITADRDDSAIGVLLGIGNGTFGAHTQYVAANGKARSIDLGDLNGDGKLDIAVADNAVGGGVNVLLGNGNGTFGGKILYPGGDSAFRVALGDFNRDGIIDIAASFTVGENYIGIYLGQGNGTFNSMTEYSVNSTPTRLAVADLNGDGLLDLVANAENTDSISILYGKVDGTFTPTQSVAVGNRPYGVTIGDFNGDKVNDIVTSHYGESYTTVLLANRIEISALQYLGFNTFEGVQSSIQLIKEALDRVSAKLSSIGAAQSRLSHTVNHLQVMRENYAAANSKIVDADIAEEVAQMVRQQILQQAITAVMAQANQQPALVLELLK